MTAEEFEAEYNRNMYIDLFHGEMLKHLNHKDDMLVIQRYEDVQQFVDVDKLSKYDKFLLDDLIENYNIRVLHIPKPKLSMKQLKELIQKHNNG